MDQLRLDGKISLITGGSKGIGFAIAKAFAERGSDIVLLSRSKDNLLRAKAELADTGRQIWTYAFDTSNVEEISDMYSSIVADTGGIDILVNNAGGTRRAPAEEVSLEDWNFIIGINLTSVFVMSQAFARERIKTGKKGKIINIASMTSEGARQNNSAYGASKGGIRQLTKGLAVDWAKYGINVNAMGPGYIKTEMTKPLWQDPKFDTWVKQRTPMGRWGLPDDLAYTAVFLAAPASNFVTGHILYVDGGWLSTF